MKENKLVIFYGPRKIGKTSLLQKVIPHLKTLGCEVSGVISPAVFQNGEKVGIQIEDIATGERRQLARLRQKRDLQDATPGYEFDEISLEWGNKVLKHAVPTQVLIIDELGPLEIKFRKGWQNGVEAVCSGSFGLCIVVLREELHEIVRNEWEVTDWVAYQPTLQEDCFDCYLFQDD